MQAYPAFHVGDISYITLKYYLSTFGKEANFLRQPWHFLKGNVVSLDF
jgi:hypothetical protein